MNTLKYWVEVILATMCSCFVAYSSPAHAFGIFCGLFLFIVQFNMEDDL